MAFDGFASMWGGFIIQTAANFNKLPAIRRLNFEISSLREKKKKKKK